MANDSTKNVSSLLKPGSLPIDKSPSLPRIMILLKEPRVLTTDAIRKESEIFLSDYTLRMNAQVKPTTFKQAAILWEENI